MRPLSAPASRALLRLHQVERLRWKLIPNGPQVTFASESFIDELAAAAHVDPIEFRLRLLAGTDADDNGFRRARSIAVVKAAAEVYGWDARPSPAFDPVLAARSRGNADVLTGRGFAYAFRNQTVVAQIAEVEVNRLTGRVWVKRLVCAHDCGLVVNPEAAQGRGCLTRTTET